MPVVNYASETVYRKNGAIKYRNGVSYANNVSASNLGTTSRSGFSDPDWKVKIAKGEDAAHSYSLRAYEQSRNLAYSSCQEIGGLKAYYNAINYLDGLGGLLTTMPTDPELDDQALTKLKRKLNEVDGTFRSLVPLGEIHKTRRLIGQTADTTSELLKSLLLVVDKKNSKRAWNAASKAWLNFSFGIKPTLSDIDHLIGSVASQLQSQDNYVVAKGSASKTWVTSNKSALDLPACGYHTWVAGPTEGIYQHRVQYTAGYRPAVYSGNTYLPLLEHYGLTLGDVLPALWELTIGSWVVDYFTTAGDYLEDSFTSPSGSTVYCCKSEKLIREQSLSYRLVNNSPSVAFTTSDGYHKVTDRTVLFQRSVLTQLPRRALRFKTSDEIARNAVNRVLNLASLLRFKGGSALRGSTKLLTQTNFHRIL